MNRVGRFAVTVLGFAAAAILAGIIVGCSTDGPTAPTPTTEAPPPVAAATPPAPSPTPTPGAVGEGPAAYELTCSSGAKLSVKYNGPASHAQVETWWTTFDNQNPNPRPGLQTDLVAIGGTVNRTFEACQQGDARGIPGKEIGGCFFDINGNPFNATKEPAKTKACRDRCVPEWRELEERTTGEWEDTQSASALNAETQTSKCYKTQRRLIIIYEENKCPQERREKRRFYEYREVEIPCPCTYSQSHTVTKVDFDFEWWGALDEAEVRAEVRGAGAWKLELVASPSNSASDTTQERATSGTIKDSDSVTQTCNQKKELRVEHGDHPWLYWWYRVRLDGNVVFTSQRYSE